FKRGAAASAIVDRAHNAKTVQELIAAEKAAPVPLASGDFGPLSADTALGRAAGIKQASLIKPTALQSLAGTGLVVGGFLRGSFVGGGSQTGRLLGGISGGLLGGALGASGLLGGGIASSFGTLAPLLTNPITIAIAGGLLLTAFILGQRAKRELNN